MLEALTKFGGYRIDQFEQNRGNADAFALYVRGGLVPGSLYSLEPSLCGRFDLSGGKEETGDALIDMPKMSERIGVFY